MDEYSSEQEQIDELKKWWSENGRYVITGLALGLAMLFGYRAWVDARNAKLEDASLQYSLLQDAVDRKDAEAADGLLAVLEADYASTPYLDQAFLAVARLRVENGDLGGAAETLERALEARDEMLVRIARLRLARVRLEQGQVEQALALVPESAAGNLAAQFAEARGDIHVAAGRPEAARGEYQLALREAEEGGPLDSGLVEMKLTQLGPAPAAAGGVDE